jgi:predicted acetyltransferase
MKLSAADKKEFAELQAKYEEARYALMMFMREAADDAETEFNDWSEKKQEGEKGQEFKERFEAMREAADNLDPDANAEDHLSTVRDF